MANPIAHLKVGIEFTWNGERVRVVALTAETVHLATPTGPALVALGDALTALAASELTATNEEPSPFDAPISGIPADAVEEARQWLRDVQEVKYGVPHLVEELDVTPTIRPQYDPTRTTLVERIAAKAAERGVATKTVRRKLNQIDKGLIGMLDRRAVRALGIETNADAAENRRRTREALKAVLDRHTTKSNITKSQMRELTQIELDAVWGRGVVSVPPERTFNRLVDEVGAGRGLFGPAKGRRSISNRPQTAYGSLKATRPGEYVLFDSTILDVFALDPVTQSWVRADLTVALDLFTRCVVGFRLSHTSAKAVDAALLLHDILSPKPASASLPPNGRWKYTGVPKSIVLDRYGLEWTTELAGIPTVEPETAVIDRGKVYVSDAFLGAASALGVNVIMARPRTPTDKPQIERFFRTLRQGLLERLPAYKGAAVYDRGEGIEHDAVYTLDELEEIIGNWIATVYHRKPHRGLHLEATPHLELSPNDMYEAGLARAGYVSVVRDESILFSLLPTVWGTIQHYGFDHDGIRYDSEALNDFRKSVMAKSPYGGKHAGKWPFRYDARDVSKLFFQNPDDRTWHAIPWHGAEEGPVRVFDEALVAYAKTKMLERGGKGTRAIVDTIWDLLDRVDSGQATKADVRAVAKAEFRGAAAKRDTKTAAIHELPAPPPAPAPTEQEADEVIVPFGRLDFGSEPLTPVLVDLDFDDEDDTELGDDGDDW